MIEINGVRTDCSTGEKRAVKLQAEILNTADGSKMFKLYGGVTGDESVYITPDTYAEFISNKDYWVACMGECGVALPKHDRLIVYFSEMRKVFDRKMVKENFKWRY